MLNMLLIMLLFILIILSQISSDSKENMTNIYNNYNKYLNNKTSIIIRNNIYKPNESIEITSLPTCNKNILVDYGLNINPINNDGVTINHTINDPLLHTIEVDNNNYNLVKIEWRKTNFTLNNKPIGLTLHLIHSDYKTSAKLNIIIPLDLIDINENIESFKNIFYNKMDNFFKTHIPTSLVDTKRTFSNLDNSITDLSNSFSDIGDTTENTNEFKNKFNLSINYKRKYNIKNININSLLKNKNEIPIYQCCKNTIGPIIYMNLCLLKIIIESNNMYYIIKEENGNISLITEPNIFDEDNGLFIRSYINPDENLIFLKP